MKTRSLLFTATASLLLAFALLPAGVYAQQMNYQGRLTDSSGNILTDGQYSLTFELFDDPTAGTRVWGPFQSDDQTGDGHGTKADLVNGRFNVILGPKDTAGHPLAGAFGAVGTRYLQITVGSTPLLPRQQILSAPEALHSINADHALLADGISGNLNVTGDFAVGGVSTLAGKITAPGGFNGDVVFGGAITVTNKVNILATADFGTTARQMINLNGAATGIGAQGNNPYFRSGGNFYWYRGGVHAPNGGDPGAGGKLLMFYDAGGLSVYGETAATAAAATFYTQSKGPNYSSIHYGAKGDWYIRSAANDGTVNIQDNGGPIAIGGNITLANGAKIGIGGAPSFPLHVKSQNIYSYPGGVGDLGNYSGGVYQHFAFPNTSYSIVADYAMLAPSFQATSDRRIKENITASDTSKDLETIQKLKVSNYQLVDRSFKGDAVQKGFIAQEVRDVIPEAVSSSPNYLPNILAHASETHFDASQKTLTVKLAKGHELKAGDRVRMQSKTGDLELTVSAVASDREFTVQDCSRDPGSVFVYGTWVPDLLNVNYDRIFTTGIGAIQELARQVKTLEENQKRFVELQQKADRVDTLEKEVAELKTALHKITQAQAAIPSQQNLAIAR